MRFSSTRTGEPTVDLRQAIFRALAPDGGLYHPTSEPDLRASILRFGEEHSFQQIAAETLHGLFPEDFSIEYARDIAKRAFPFSPALKRISESVYLLELFHGPSCAFKDFGASFLAELMEDALAESGRRATILTATSGDTGSAVAKAFYDKENIDVVILYPSGRVSPLQEKQLTTLGGNVTAVEVSGSFDDCQRMVKDVFRDEALTTELNLTSANSINLGRLIPQSFYYLYGFAHMKSRAPGEFLYCVPSGNFGNLTAGVLAWKWGMPVTGFVAATNVNDVVPRYLETGVYSPRISVKTLSNAMDVGNPSNFERLQKLFSDGFLDMRAMITGEVVTDEETLEVMQRYYRDHNTLLDPHTAAGVSAAERFLEEHFPNVGRVITLGTAHPGKFAEITEKATGVSPEIPQRLLKHMELEKQAVGLEPDSDRLKEFLRDRAG